MKRNLFTLGLFSLALAACGGGDNGENGLDGKDGKDGASCTITNNEDGTATITCPDGSSFTVKNGKNGKKGDAGSDGNDGESCHVTDNSDGSATISCPDGSSFTVKNGEKGLTGDAGSDGQNGIGCSVKDGGNGTVTVTCGDADPVTLYKAMCGSEFYDPAKSFCLGGELFSCEGKPYDPQKQICDTRDNQIYGYVTIVVGDYAETWMAENLNYSVNANEQSWCGGGIDSTEGDCTVYGRLYTWAAAVDKTEEECGEGHKCDLSGVLNEKGDVRGICPEGWHLPSNAEWKNLFDTVGGTDIAGQKLKADSELWTHDERISNDDSFGFAVLPSGYRSYDRNFYGKGNYTYFWSSTENDSNYVDSWNFLYANDSVFDYEDNKKLGYSVRCIKDSN